MKRIEAMEPELTQGMIRFSGRHALLLGQACQLPFGVHEHGRGALDLPMKLARQALPLKGKEEIYIHAPDWI